MKVIPVREKIVEVMLKKGFSAEKLAKEANVSRNCIYRIGKGEVAFVQARVAKSITDALEVGFNELFTIQ